MENATIVYNRAQFVPRVYTGKNIKVEPVNGNIYYTLQGDVKDATVEYKIKGASNDFATDLFVTKAGEYEFLHQTTMCTLQMRQMRLSLKLEGFM